MEITVPIEIFVIYCKKLSARVRCTVIYDLCGHGIDLCRTNKVIQVSSRVGVKR